MSNDQIIPIGLNPVKPIEADVHPVVRKVGEVTGALAVGAVGGYVFYWITRLVARLGLLGELAPGAIHPLPYILSGVISAALVQTAKLVYDAALHALGNRDDYLNKGSDFQESAVSGLRRHSWKVITKLEKVQDDTDLLFSRLFDIRTAKEIREQKIADRDMYLVEIVRRAFWEQAAETMTTSVPQELGVYAVEACGYTIFGGHLFVWLHGLTFVSGLMNRVQVVYQKIDHEIFEEKQKAKQAAVDISPADDKVGKPDISPSPEAIPDNDRLEA